MTRKNRRGTLPHMLRPAIPLALMLALALPGLPAGAFEPDAEQTGAADGNGAGTELERKRNETREELAAIARTLEISGDRSRTLENEISRLTKSSDDVRAALIESAARRKKLEADLIGSENRLSGLRLREDGLRASLKERRGLLAEVLGALERMGRNPPPALLVTPDDALASVRSAILLGAVVPGMRRETERLVADLTDLATTRAAIAKERADLALTLTANLEEERRMDLLLAENARLEQQSAENLAGERRRASELAARATSLEGLIASIETEIASVRRAAELARQEEERRRNLSEAERQKARDSAAVPDKNRIAPAYAFADLKGKLDYPVEGEVLRRFGEDDGTGHPSRGMVVASRQDAVVTAPADGSVVFAGNFRSYGEVIILNMGDGYHMVLSGMDQVKARTGKFVFSGEPIAVMGAKRVASAAALALETDRPTLYIELSKDKVAVDSRPWWSATDAGKARNDS